MLKLMLASAGLFAALALPAAFGQAAAATQDAKPTTGKVGELMPAHSAKVMRGDKEATIDVTKPGKTTVWMLVGVTCPASAPYCERLVALEKAYGAKDVDFVYVYPNVTESVADKKKFHASSKFTGAFFSDEGAALIKKLKAGKTGEAIVTDKDGKVLFRGGIDDNCNEPAKVKTKFLANALDEIVAGKPVTKTTGTVFG